MDEVCALGALKTLTEACHKDIEVLNEFLTEISQAQTLSHGEVISSLENLSGPSSHTRTQLNAIKGLLTQALKVKFSCLFIKIKFAVLEKRWCHL